MRSGGAVLRSPVWVLLFVLLAAPARAQTGQNFGEIVGKVADEQGAVLPGVTVTLSGPALMTPQTAVSNERGLYRFPAVPSGTYKLSFEVVGFSNLVRDEIVVPVRQTITIDAQMRVARLQETVTVSGASPVVDIENTKIGERLDKLVLETVPTSRSIFGSATLLPGMVMTRQDPAGLNAATSTGMTAHGAGTYNLNYFGVTADTPQNYGSMYYMDYGAAEEISVDTAAMGAEIGGGGGANINIIPKSGGNRLKGSLYYGYTNKDLAADNVDDELRAQGITVGTRLLRLGDINTDVGGPFVRNRFWWWGSFRNYTTFERVIGFDKDFESNLRNYSARLNYQLTQNNQLSGFWTYNRKFQPNRGAGTTQPDPVTTINQQSPKHLYNLNYISVLSQNLVLETSSSFFWMHWPSRYSDEFYALPEAQQTASMQNITTGVFSGPEPTGERLRDAYRFQVNTALTRYQDGLLGASHQMKVGFETWQGWGTDEFKVFRDTRLRFRNVNGVTTPAEVFAYNTPLIQETHMRNFAAFLQDRLTYPRITLNLGVRWQFYDGYLPEQSGGGGRWFPETVYPRIDSGFNWSTIVPRTGVIWKITEDARNIGKASYSRYADVMYTGEFADVINPNLIRTTGVATYRWFGDANGNGIVDSGEYDPVPTSVFQPRSNSIDPDLKEPTADEITLGYSRELANNLGLNVAWIQRWYHDATVDMNVGIPVTGYSPRAFNDPGPDNLVNTADDRPITLHEVMAEYQGKDAFFHTNFPGTQRYKGFEVSLTKRMSNRWQLSGSYVWSRLDGEIVQDPNDPNNLIPSMKTGRGTSDQPQAFKVIGTYRAPFDVNIGVNYQALTGLPTNRDFRASLRQGTVTVRAEPRGVYRNDFLNLMSLKLDKSFRFGQSNIAGFVEVHNLLNTNAAQGYSTLTQAYTSQAQFDANRSTTAYFGRVSEIIAPRIVKFGARLQF
jgi:carboxypeptidase family protein